MAESSGGVPRAIYGLWIFRFIMERSSAVVYLAIIIIKWNLFQAMLIYILLHGVILSKDQITDFFGEDLHCIPLETCCAM